MTDNIGTGAKKVIIGIDGVPIGLIEGLIDKGRMPNFASLVSEGNLSAMRAAIPEVSNVNWTSIVTGKNPGEHGVFGFTDLIEGTYTINFPDRRAVKASPFWDDEERKYVILNVPAMYPAPDINGTFVSGFVSPDLEKAVRPKSALSVLEEMDYQVDVDSEKAHKSKRLFLHQLFETLEKREKAYRHFWDEKWDIFMLVFTGSDRLEHFLFDAYLEEDHEYHERFIEYFEEVDRIIGEIVEKMDEEDELIMLSDHGMELIKQNVNLNKVLEDNGLLKTGDEPSERYRNIKEGTKAFVLDPGRVYLNRKGKYPRGGVQESEEEELLDKITDLFKDLRFDGEKVIEEVNRKDEIYSGEETERGPDLVLTPASGYNLKGSMKYDSVFERNIFKGKHTLKDAFLFRRNGPLPDEPKVEDVRSLIDD
ncbi:MAG: alkaline phosphatase family protein [Candidatus Natronoplasma sp.]